MSQTHPDHSQAAGGLGLAGESLWSASFLGLLFTQLLTATNDNIFRWLVIGIGKDYFPTNTTLVLSIGTACFVAPYLVLAAPAGFLADRFSKRNVIIACKAAEVVTMLLGIAAIMLGWIYPLFAIVAVMGGHSALFSPAKLGAIPELLKPEKISAANGLFGLTTVVSTVIGMGVGNYLSDISGAFGRENPVPAALVLLGVAAVGVAFSFLIRPLPVANPARTFPWNAPTQTWRDIKTLASYPALLRVTLGIVFFWSVGAIAQMNIDQLATEGGATTDAAKNPLLISLVVGVGVGSVLAGIWSRGHVELGILPLGAAGIALAGMLLFTVPAHIFEANGEMSGGLVWTCALLGALGVSAGLFSIPLEAYMQHRSPVDRRGSILSAMNFLVMFGVIVTTALYAVLRMPIDGEPWLNAREVFLLFGVLTVPVFIYIVTVIPQATVRFTVWLLSIFVYRIRIHGRENLPREGGALLVPNHVSWLDGVLLGVTSSRPIRMVVWGASINAKALRWLIHRFGVIPLSHRPKEIAAALQTAREALNNGELVCVFAEGGISRTGQVQSFRPGIMKILKGTDVPVVPVYLDQLWGSIFSFQGGKFFWKRPQRWPYPVSIHFGPPVARRDDLHYIRQAVQQLGTRAVQQRSENYTPVPIGFIRQCKGRKFTPKVRDTMGGELKGGELLLRSLILRRLLRRHVLKDDEQYVGLLVPPSAAGVIANVALTLDRRIVANLNYSTSSEVINGCIQDAGITHVVTSRQFMSKMNFDIKAELVYLEDFKTKVTKADKVAGAIGAYVTPAGILARQLGLQRILPDDVLTVIFTSGSTGRPKGVMLTHKNVASNVEAIDQVMHLTHDDVLLCVLPFFHSLGYTVTLWGVLTLDIQGAYHYTPLDAKRIGKLCRESRSTVLLATPTFLRSYLRRCEKEDMESLDVVVAGAEKLPKDLCDAFEAKFGVRPVEGYGTTELSPLVSVNVPPSRSFDENQITLKEGTVGRPVPAVSAKTVHLETGEELSAGQEGMLLVTGPNVMKGYLHREKETAAVMRDGWYVTGDVALIDEDGFIKITGRESRFSKIGGEMVPHIAIEEAMNRIVGASEEEGPKCAVTAVPDPKKGERLIVIHTRLDKTPGEICKALSESGFSNLFIPDGEAFLEVKELPVLGSGKLDLKGVKQVALERFAPKEEAAQSRG
jgi:acyl-[acyl-carrier-protein]-phospholipid O-acyltransferase/long-chain-fatty-acid--[acyl-carrier-protein] ligase